MKKEYRPMAWGFWAVGLPLGLFGLLFGRTAAERWTVLLLAAALVVTGAFILRAKR